MHVGLRYHDVPGLSYMAVSMFAPKLIAQ